MSKLATTANQSRWDRAHFRDLLLSGLMLVLLVVLQSNSYATEDAFFPSLNDIGSGSLVVQSPNGYQGLVLLNTEVNIDVAGMLLNASIQQRFVNQTQDWVEATYVFPLPSDSAVNSMRIQIGERVIEGQIKEHKQARKLFIKAKQQGKQAGLMEQQRPNLFTTRVANVGPGETIVVDFGYLQTLQYQAGEFSLRLPLTLTPRYIPGQATFAEHEAGFLLGDAIFDTPATISPSGWALPTSQVLDAPEITPPQIAASSALQSSHQASINVNLAPGFDVAEVMSPYHDISTQRHSASYLVAPKVNPVLMNRDFVLTWRPVAQQAPTAAVFREDNHGLLMLMPPHELHQDVVPPRELTIIIDTSGSMAGDSIVQAKQAVLMALDRLRPSDQFNLIEFNSHHQVLFPQAQLAQGAALQQARRFVNRLQANGGTEMYGALEAALRFPENEHYLRQVVFITDGSVGNETALLDLIHRELGRARLYTVGIGEAPNEFFMRKAAEFGKGTFEMIGSTQEVQDKMAALFDKIEKPVLTQLMVSAVGVQSEIFPQVLPDLYQGEPLVVNAKFDQWPDELMVQGVFNGHHWQQVVVVAQQGDVDGVGTLWARRKVQSLEDQGIRSGDRDAHKPEITQLGLDYSIVTRFTSFIAVAKEVVRTHDPLKAKTIPNVMPKGSTQPSPSVAMPSTALGLKFQMMLGVFCLGLVLLLYRLKHHCHFSEIRCAR